MRPHSRYTTTEIDTALLMVSFCGRNCAEASRRLEQQGIDVMDRTLNNWIRTTHAHRYAQLEREHAPELERQMISQARSIVTTANEGTLEAIEASREQIRAGQAKDPSTVARNLATAAGIQTDKSLLLEGRPTEIHGTQDIDALIAQMANRLGWDSTAEEITDDAPGELPPAAYDSPPPSS